jgi:3-oxoacyl-[acyl-carrier protein] reductase
VQSGKAENPVALVTGSRTGLGRAIATHLVGRGYSVIGCSRKPIAEPIPGDYVHQLCDVTDEPALVQLIRGIDKQHRRLDVLVNNAGIASMNHALLTPGSTLERIFKVNVLGSFVAAREAAKVMQRRRFGRIVNLSTVAVPLRLGGEAAYAASKSAVETMTKVLARELGRLGVTVNALGPSPIDTDLIAGVPSDAIDAIVKQGAIPRRGEARDVLNVVDFFIAPGSDFVTGQVIYLGGFG